MSVTRVQLVGNVSTGASFAGIVTATSFSGNVTGTAHNSIAWHFVKCSVRRKCNNVTVKIEITVFHKQD